jgi:hypothetical protein
LLVKEPTPVPSVVFVESEIVGFVVVPQTTPLAVIAYPLSEEMFPPLEAEVVVIEPIAEVEEILGDEPTNVVKDISEP